MINDTIGDLIIRLKNAGAVKKTSVSIPFSNFKYSVIDKLKSVGYVADFEKKGKKVQKTIAVTLKYSDKGAHVISGVKRISKPGKRVYRSVLEINPVRYGHGDLILSTPQGIMTGKEARKAKVGGEALFEIW